MSKLESGSACLLVLLGGCFSKTINYTPKGVEQRIGAAPAMLATADAVWRCEGGERFALVEDGKTLFVASMDLFLRDPEVVPEGMYFSYRRYGDNVHDTTGVIATFFVPVDHISNLELLYGARYVTGTDSSTKQIGNWTIYSHTTIRELFSVRADSCWREGTGADQAEQLQAVYEGAELHEGGPPPGGKHLVLHDCTLTDDGDWGLAEASALVPHDLWIPASGGAPLFVRPDGTGIRLTNATVYGDRHGWKYTRAGVPVFVSPAEKPAGVFVFPFMAAPNKEHAIFCEYKEAS